MNKIFFLFFPSATLCYDERAEFLSKKKLHLMLLSLQNSPLSFTHFESMIMKREMHTHFIFKNIYSALNISSVTFVFDGKSIWNQLKLKFILINEY